MTVAPGARLRQLAEAATPGPWSSGADGIDGCYFVHEPPHPYRSEGSPHGISLLSESDAELIALAPSLAVLCADMADALAGIKAEIPDVRERNRTLFGGVNVYLGADEAATVDALLARFRALTQEPT